MISGYPGIEQDLHRAIAVDVKRWAIANFIPEENLNTELVRHADYLGFTAYIQMFMAGKKDERSVRDTTEGTIPASLWDWFKFHVNSMLPSWMEPVKVKTVPLIRRHEEVWRVCPHLSVKQGSDHIRPHLRFMEFGGDFENLAEEQRKLAERILNAVTSMQPNTFYHVPPEIMWLSQEYRRCSGAE